LHFMSLYKWDREMFSNDNTSATFINCFRLSKIRFPWGAAECPTSTVPGFKRVDLKLPAFPRKASLLI
jgi:hypothetical protein